MCLLHGSRTVPELFSVGPVFPYCSIRGPPSTPRRATREGTGVPRENSGPTLGSVGGSGSGAETEGVNRFRRHCIRVTRPCPVGDWEFLISALYADITTMSRVKSLLGFRLSQIPGMNHGDRRYWERGPGASPSVLKVREQEERFRGNLPERQLGSCGLKKHRVSESGKRKGTRTTGVENRSVPGPGDGPLGYNHSRSTDRRHAGAVKFCQ